MRSTVLRELFPDGVCAVEEFAIQTTQFSDPTLFVTVTVDDTVYGPFGGPWMATRGVSSVQTPGPRARRGQRKATAAALLCRIDGKDVWIPKSQIDDDSEVWQEGDEGRLVVSEWTAIEKRLF